MFRTLIKYLKVTFSKSPLYTILGMGFIIVFRLLQLCMDLALKFATDSILTARSGWDIIFPFILFFVAMMLGGNTGNLNGLLTTLYTNKSIKFFTKRFMKRAYDEKQDTYYDSHFYNEYEFVKNNINNTSQISVTVFSNLFSSIVSLCITIAAMSFFSPLIVLVVSVLSIFTVVINYFTVKKRVALNNEYINKERHAGYYSQLLSDRKHAKELRIFQLQSVFLKKWDNSFMEFSKTRLRFDSKSNWLLNISVILEQLLSGVMILFFLYQVSVGKLGIGDFVLMYRMMWRLSYGVSSIVNILSSEMLQNYEYIKKYDKLISSVNAPMERTAVSEPMSFESLELKNVTYSYPAQKGNAVNHVDFCIQKGEIVSILGYNGSGKSTLSKIMCGLLENYQGQVLLNGKDITLLERSKIYPNYGIAFQDFTRYSLSLRENVMIGMIEQKNDESVLQQAMDKGNLDEIIKTLPNGEDTILGKEYDSQGQDLSGGQWQRVILSRAYMGNPPLLILDEPTASIDPIQEMKMLINFRQIINGQTAILISHRVGFARLSDRIYIMDDGKIVEQGTHEELLEKDGVYAHLYNSQKHLYVDGGEGVV